MNRDEVEQWLREEDQHRLESLWRNADDVRRRNVGDDVQLRGLAEISNHCARRCAYCGINAENTSITRYRLTSPEILSCARKAVEFGYGTLVMQAGEDYGIAAEWLAEVIREIKRQTPLAVTLSLGERRLDEFALWRNAGADRYLLRFETSNTELYREIHPPLPGQTADRFELLEAIRSLGYEVGSGVMVGIPGQNFADLARDIELFRELDLEMIGVGPYLPHPHTPLGRRPPAGESAPDQVPNSETMTCKVVALTRLVCPQANIPSTTALATLNQSRGRQLGLQRGANVVMPNLTPLQYRTLYEIYPAKACLQESPENFHLQLKACLYSIGRFPGTGRGDSPRFRRRQNEMNRNGSDKT